MKKQNKPNKPDKGLLALLSLVYFSKDCTPRLNELLKPIVDDFYQDIANNIFEKEMRKKI